MARLPILDKLDQELKDSQKELQVEIPKALKTAREHGDLSENAEFKAAKERQMFLESRVSLLQKRISDITSINLDKIPNDRSGLGSTLYLRDLNTGEETDSSLDVLERFKDIEILALQETLGIKLKLKNAPKSPSIANRML